MFGQALLSMDLIRMRWAPRSLRSVLICTADDPYLRSVIGAFPDIEVHVARSERRASFGLTRLPGAAADLASQRGVLLVENRRLTPTFRIDGVIVPSYDPRRQLPLAGLVVGEKVITVHSEATRLRTRRLGMWMSGEVIAAQRLLLRMGAAAVHSIVLCRRDQAIEAALRRHASFEILEAAPAPASGQPAGLAIAATPSQLGPRESTPAMGRLISRRQNRTAGSAVPPQSGPTLTRSSFRRTTAAFAAGHSRPRGAEHDASIRQPASEGSSYHCICADTGAPTTTGCIPNGGTCNRKLPVLEHEIVNLLSWSGISAVEYTNYGQVETARIESIYQYNAHPEDNLLTHDRYSRS